MRHIVSTFDNTARSFGGRRDGSVAMLFAGACAVVFLTAGAAIDFSSASRIKGAAESAVDSASLAVAKLAAAGVTDQAVLNAEGRAVFDVNFAAYTASGYVPSAFTVSPPASDNTVTVRAELSVPTSFMQLAGVQTMPVSAQSSAHTGKLVELSMMLDLTGSMGSYTVDENGTWRSKIDVLEDAAKDAVRDLLPTGSTPSKKMRIALVPFSQGVNAGSAAAYASKNKSKACVFERTGAEMLTDTAPDFAPVPAGSSCTGKAVVPLTNDRASLLAALDNLPATGSTAGLLGTAWSYYTLSASWKGAFPAASEPKPVGTADLEKISILMTDGQYNTFAGSMKVSAAKVMADAVDMCTAMKASGITVYTVGFDIDADADAKATLTACASTVDGKAAFYNAKTGTQLRAAYADIIARIQAIRLAA